MVSYPSIELGQISFLSSFLIQSSWVFEHFFQLHNALPSLFSSSSSVKGNEKKRTAGIGFRSTANYLGNRFFSVPFSVAVHLRSIRSNCLKRNTETTF